jgi:hypothetical protein
MQQQQGEQAEEYDPRNGASHRLLLEQRSTDEDADHHKRKAANKRIVDDHLGGAGQVGVHCDFRPWR